MTKKKKTLIIRILLFGGTAISMFFVPWILVKAWILPLPDTVQEQVDEAIGHGFDGMIEIAKEIRKTNPKIPLMVQANAGLPQLIDGQNVFPESPEEMASKLPRLIDLGVNIIGGCCGTTPDHIAKFAEVIKKSVIEKNK